VRFVSGFIANFFVRNVMPWALMEAALASYVFAGQQECDLAKA
jgi:hypothetical protein